MPRRSAAKNRPAEDEPLVIRDAASLKALAEPVRLQILLELGQGPRTVKEVAAALGGGATRLYYHFKILERARLIRVAGRRMVSGIEERSYEATATSWTVAPEITPDLVSSGVIGGITDVVEAELELALGVRGEAPLGEPGSPVPIMSFTRLALSEDEVADVQRRIESIMLDYGETSGGAPEGKRIYHAFLAGYQAPVELRDRISSVAREGDADEQ